VIEELRALMTFLSTQDQALSAAGEEPMQYVADCLHNSPDPVSCALPLEEARSEGILPWLAYALRSSGAIEQVPEEQRAELQNSLEAEFGDKNVNAVIIKC